VIDTREHVLLVPTGAQVSAVADETPPSATYEGLAFGCRETCRGWLRMARSPSARSIVWYALESRKCNLQALYLSTKAALARINERDLESSRPCRSTSAGGER
jgi:hypothetical protein